MARQRHRRLVIDGRKRAGIFARLGARTGQTNSLPLIRPGHKPIERRDPADNVVARLL